MSIENFVYPDKKIIFRGAHFGLFANLYTVLGLLDLFERKIIGGLHIECNWNCLYSDNNEDNFWEYCFEKINIEHDDYENQEFDPKFLGFVAIHGKTLPLKWANYLFNNFVKVKMFIYDEIFKIQKEKFKNNFIVGLHYRGTDKKIESTIVPYDFIIKILDENLNKLNTKCFIATDEQKLIDLLVNRFNEKIIFNNFTRCDEINNNGIHNIKNVKGSIKMKEALIDSMLLSTCHKLIRTDSNLSEFSMVFNPYIENINCTKLYVNNL